MLVAAEEVGAVSPAVCQVMSLQRVEVGAVAVWAGGAMA